jgi:hypothetical protein
VCLAQIHELVEGSGSDRSAFKSAYAFRLIYNGQVLTDRIEGCPVNAELCDASYLIRRVSSFATRARDCSPTSIEGPSQTMTTIKSLLSKVSRVGIFVFIRAG